MPQIEALARMNSCVDREITDRAFLSRLAFQTIVACGRNRRNEMTEAESPRASTPRFQLMTTVMIRHNSRTISLILNKWSPLNFNDDLFIDNRSSQYWIRFSLLFILNQLRG